MQGLTNYGSDSDDDSAAIASSSKLPTASQDLTKSVNSLLAQSNSAKGAPITPISTVPSRSQTPSLLLPGLIKLSPAPSSVNSPNPYVKSSTTVSKGKSKLLERRRLTSTSPPPFTNSSSTREGDAEMQGEDQDMGENASLNGLSLDGIQMNSLSEFGIPPIATGVVNPNVQAKLANFYHLSQTRNLHFNDSLAASKAFRNPRIYAKLVEYVGVGDEGRSNWKPEVWDRRLEQNATARYIAEVQKTRFENKTAGQAPGLRSSIAFAPSSSSTSSNLTTKETKDRDREKKKSRWDANTNADRERERERERGGGVRDRDRSGKRDRSRSASPRRR